jgi:hypothetical protein
MVIPFRLEKPERALSTKFGQRLILMWPFGETNAAVMRTLKSVKAVIGRRSRERAFCPFHRVGLKWVKQVAF